MRVRIALVVVLFYLTGAFVWWAYSLISLSREQYNSKLNNLNMESVLVLIELEYALNDIENDNLPEIYLYNKKIKLDTNNIRNRFMELENKGFDLHFRKKATSPEMFYAVVEPSFYRIQAIEKEWKSRQRAYYSEAVFFLFLLLLGVFWMFQSTEKIIRLTQMQKNFMLSVTHELKTPVAAIKLIIQTLKKRVLSEEKQKELLQNADINSDRLNILIESMMMATRLESKSFFPQMERLSLKPLLEETVHEVLNGISKKVSIGTDIPEEYAINADKPAIKLVFSNLIENAIKYNFGTPELKISAEEKGNSLYLHFTDNGEGIPENEKRNIFRKFYRIGNEETRRTKGTGLGLYIVKNILKLHKAKITILDNQPKGSIFTIVFQKPE